MSTQMVNCIWMRIICRRRRINQIKNSAQEIPVFSGQEKKEESIKVLDKNKLKMWENSKNNV